jgi:cytochrome c
MATWKYFEHDESHKALNTSGQYFTDAEIAYNQPMTSGYPRFRIKIRKANMPLGKEGEQQHTSITVELTDDEVLALAKFVTDFSTKYQARFKKYQDDIDKEPKMKRRPSFGFRYRKGK